jgi:hypothetical protein
LSTPLVVGGVGDVCLFVLVYVMLMLMTTQTTNSAAVKALYAKEYRAWQNMKTRCNNPKANRYKYYGGRGIKICERWSEFKLFLEDIGKAPGPEYSIDRIDVNKGYSPDNCRWASPRQQANNRRNNRHIVYEGESLTVAQLVRKLGMGKRTVEYRLKMGWPVEMLGRPATGRPHDE